jgi:hypothetical protein
LINTIKDETMSGMTAPSQEGMSDFLTQAISLSHDLLNELLFQIQTLPLFSSDIELQWNRKLSILISDLGQFVELTTLSTKYLTQKRNIELPMIKDSHVHLLFVMKAIIQANQKKDALVLDDLIKYELKDNLTQWKIDLLHQMKRLLSA